jgi:hypothetical protein
MRRRETVGEQREPWPPSDQRPQPPRDGADGPAPDQRSGPDGPAPEPGRVNPGLDLDELDPSGRVRARAARRRSGDGGRGSRRRRILEFTALGTAALLLVVVAAGFYLVHHLLGNVATISLGGLANRPAAARPDAQGRSPLNVLVLGSQTRDGQTLATHVG